MREQYDTSGPGKFENEGPIVRYLYERMETADQESGTSEAPTGWFARFGKWLIGGTTRGFVWSHKYDTPEQASGIFDNMTAEYSEWATEEEANESV